MMFETHVVLLPVRSPGCFCHQKDSSKSACAAFPLSGQTCDAVKMLLEKKVIVEKMCCMRVSQFVIVWRRKGGRRWLVSRFDAWHVRCVNV